MTTDSPETVRRYVATVTHSYQDGPESVASELRHFVVSEATTVGEIATWALQFRDWPPSEKFPLGPITIMETR